MPVAKRTIRVDVVRRPSPVAVQRKGAPEALSKDEQVRLTALRAEIDEQLVRTQRRQTREHASFAAPRIHAKSYTRPSSSQFIEKVLPGHRIEITRRSLRGRARRSRAVATLALSTLGRPRFHYTMACVRVQQRRRYKRRQGRRQPRLTRGRVRATDGNRRSQQSLVGVPDADPA